MHQKGELPFNSDSNTESEEKYMVQNNRSGSRGKKSEAEHSIEATHQRSVKQKSGKSLPDAFQTDLIGIKRTEMNRKRSAALIGVKKRIVRFEPQQRVSAQVVEKKTAIKPSLEATKVKKHASKPQAKVQPTPVKKASLSKQIPIKKEIPKRSAKSKDSLKKVGLQKGVEKKSLSVKPVSGKAIPVKAKSIPSKALVKKNESKKNVVGHAPAKKNVAKKAVAKKSVLGKGSLKRETTKKNVSKKVK